MTYTFTIQPDPIRINGVEADNDVQAEARVRRMLDEQREDFAKALMASKWRMVMVRDCAEATFVETAPDSNENAAE